MTIDLDDRLAIAALADAIAEHLRPLLPPTGWPPDRATLREPECAALLSIGVEKLTDLRRSGQISHRRLGRSVMYASQDVSEYLQRCRTGRDNGH